MPDERPNPDLLLKHIQADENKGKRGHFRLFFGMAAGVGKTCAMLKAARELAKTGIDVQIGVVETHGRLGTQALIEDLEVIPLKKIEYRGTILEEMDLDEILRRRPQLVLVDELAHSNIPGLRHAKRYQDVQEILEAGIDVYSTLNVQHLESRADIVGLITATQIRETIPDSVLDWVDQIELIDLTPQTLLERLKDGKIYPGRKLDQALQYFFQEKHLSALREIVLRVTADKVDRDSRGVYVKENITAAHARSTGKLLVAISHSPESDRLIRTARRIVENLEIPWVAVHVDTGVVLNTEEHNQLIKNLELASELGAQTITLHGSDIALTISDYAKDNHVIQIVVGRPEKTKFLSFSSNNLVNRLISNNPQADMTVLRYEQNRKHSKKLSHSNQSLSYSWKQNLVALAALVSTTFLSMWIEPYVGYRAIGFLYLLSVVILSASVPFPLVFLSAGISALLWNYLFIPPKGTFAISAIEDIMMCLSYFVFSAITGYLTSQVKKNQNILKQREETTRALYELLKSMTFVKGQTAIINLAISKIESLFLAECGVLTARTTDEIAEQCEYGSLQLTPNERAVAVWAYEHGKMAGWSTDTLPSAQVLCLALKSGEQKFGVLAFRSQDKRKLNPDQQNLLFSITNQISTALAKEYYENDAKDAELLKASEKLHQTLLNCISHELRTPLTTIMGASSALHNLDFKSQMPNFKLLTSELLLASETLNQLFENLLDMTRLESGLIQLKSEWFDLKELLHFILEKQKQYISSNQIQIYFFQDQPYYFFGDYDLMGHVLNNIILNALKYSSPRTQIDIAFNQVPENIMITIRDHGPGIPHDSLIQIFDKFHRLQNQTSGLGLGLSIAKNLIELHGGQIYASNHPQGGAIFTLNLPYIKPPEHILNSM